MNRNSALIWLPRIEAAGLPTPKTIIVPYEHHKCVCIFDGIGSPEVSRLTDAIMEAAREIGFPVFIRTDLASAKHSGPDAYRIDEDSHNQPIFETLEDAELKCFMDSDPEAFLVRKFLTLDAPFTAFRDLPIAREFRFFANGSCVHCWHPYWPEDSLEEHDPSNPDWRELLAGMQGTPPELGGLAMMAITAARACGGGDWSVDFCRDTDGKWWLLDMATAADSFHWPGCANEEAFK